MRILLILLFLSQWVPAVESGGGFRPDRLAAMDGAVERAVADHRIPGGVLWLENHSVRYVKAFGNRALVPAEEPMTVETVFDAAS